MALTRLNDDSSWIIEIDGTRLLLDPWLDGPAIVGLPWIHTARLAQPATDVTTLPAVDALIISHPFPDHCHAPTLAQLPGDIPAFAPAVARRQVKRFGRFNDVSVLGNCTRRGDALIVGSVSIFFLMFGILLLSTHNVLVIRGLESGRSLAYCPHGVNISDRTVGAIEHQLNDSLDLLMCSFTLLDLPFYLGGTANLGQDAALALTQHFDPHFVLPTHDGEKPDTGFIARKSRLERCSSTVEFLQSWGVEAQSPVIQRGDTWSPNTSTSTESAPYGSAG